ncbi:restriction endonuclease subunit S [Streptomyces ureilyticus]|uniref:Restriction endonuclease subunit S n=1 Tax=Streptomyces ureilyticus TaxID=1775131 RepID=A0ABX0DWE6_9ACTN|nr:restriction endonuclease subunit S [Streptomyces ureilyticus]NGO44814.1 restriction endonuclease subunit S [Streptomyces ureilyticus]
MTQAQFDLEQAWAGSVPSRWRWSRNKELLAESLSVSPEGTEELLSVSHLTGITPRSEKNVTMTTAESLDGYRLVDAGDLVINTMWAWMGALGVSKQAGIVSPAYGVYRPRPHAPFYPGFYDYLYRSTPYVMEMTRLSRGIWSSRLRIYPDVFLSMAIPVPPLEEQRAIADYLDRETARIDTFIEEQQRLIEMLRERRFALRVSVALHGTAQTEEVESPLPWATKLPAHWRVVPLTSVAELESGHTPSRSREDWWQDCYIPWVSLHDVGMMRGVKYLHDTAQRISDAGIANSSARLLPARTVVLSRDATVGRTAIMGVPMATSQHFAAWVCGPDLDPEYLWVLFEDAMQPFFDSFQNGSTIRTIGMGDLKAFRIPLPPLDEQRRIVEYLDEETSKIDMLIEEAARFIELSKERRSALITAAVTGQIDVRETA